MKLTVSSNGSDKPVSDGHIGTKGRYPFYVLLDRSHAEIASAGEAFGEFAASLPERIVVEAHLNVGGYEFGVATDQSTRTVTRSVGGYGANSAMMQQ